MPTRQTSIPLGFSLETVRDRFEFGLGLTGSFYLTISSVSRSIPVLDGNIATDSGPMVWYEEWQEESYEVCHYGVGMLPTRMYSHLFADFTCMVCICTNTLLYQHLLQWALWQHVSHRFDTDPDCSSHYNMRGYPLTWKPSNRCWAEQLALTRKPTLMDLLQSKLEELGRKSIFFFILNSKLLKGCHVFLLAVFFKRKVTETLTIADRHGTQRMFSSTQMSSWQNSWEDSERPSKNKHGSLSWST